MVEIGEFGHDAFEAWSNIKFKGEVTAEYLASLLADSQDPDVRRAVFMLLQQDYQIKDLMEWKRSLMEVNSQQQAEITLLENSLKNALLAHWKGE
jgi:hypothetical protein